jgi:DNA ligase-1
VTAVEFGHGKRIQVLSDYTFAVRKGEELVNIGKAYSGLTDKEIAELTQWFLAHTIVDHGHLREVEPKIVLEVAGRHDSGFALRFPRIVRVRQDKSPKEIDTIEEVERIYSRQHGR